jgi:hypothetical protein
VLALVAAWPSLVHHLLIARIHAATQRPVSVESVHLNPLTGRLIVEGLRVYERDGVSPFTGFERLDIHFNPLSLIARHLRIYEARLEGPTTRIVRLPEGFNISDLIEGPAAPRRWFDITVQYLVVTRGTATLEDRALAEPRTWSSERIEIEAHDLSTLRDDGRAVARSMTEGAPVSLELRRLRLQPIHLEAVVTASNIDLAPARLYFPRDAALVLERGRATSTLTVALDARAGLEASATGEITDVVMRRRGERDPAVEVPRLTLELAGLRYQDEQLEIGRFELAGEASVKDPRAGARARYQVSTVQASLGDVTWPVTRAGRLDVRSSVPGGGRLELSGRLSPPPAASQLRLRLARVDLHPWARLVPDALHVEGLAEADLRIDEPLAPAVPSHVQGAVAVNQLGIGAAGGDLLRAARVEARGLEVEWPTRVAARQVVVTRPRAAIERDRAGAITVPGMPARGVGEGPATSQGAEAGALRLAVDEVVVKEGRLVWRDRTVEPPITLDLTDVGARVRGAARPVAGPLRVQVEMRPPGGGRAEFDGRVEPELVAVEGRLRAQGAAVGPYLAYAAMPARIGGRVDFDLAVALGSGPEPRLTARGEVAASSLDVRDNERTLLRMERASASGVDIDWPRRATIRDLHVQRPWVLLERDRDNALSLRTLLTPRPAGRPAGSTAAARGDRAVRRAPDVGLGARADHRGRGLPGGGSAREPAVRPGCAGPDGPAARRLDGPRRPARAVRRGGSRGRQRAPRRPGPRRAAHRPAPSRRERRAPRLRGAADESLSAPAGGLGGAVGDAHHQSPLPHRSRRPRGEDGHLVRRLEVARAPGVDGAQARVGLPLGTIVALMKDRRGDIHVAVPVGGRLSDPRFDVSEAIWSTVRNVAVKTITAPLSWIGRVETGADARIQQVDVAPVRFEPGSATLTADGQDQLARLAAFLDQVPDIRLALTPVLSTGDRAAGDARTALSSLAARRLDAVREGIKKAGGDQDRLKATPPTDGPSSEGVVQVALLDPEPPDRAGPDPPAPGPGAGPAAVS